MLLTPLSCSPPTISRQQYGSQQSNEDDEEYIQWCQLHLGLSSYARPEGSGGIDSAYSNTPLLCTDWHLRSVYVINPDLIRIGLRMWEHFTIYILRQFVSYTFCIRLNIISGSLGSGRKVGKSMQLAISSYPSRGIWPRKIKVWNCSWGYVWDPWWIAFKKAWGKRGGEEERKRKVEEIKCLGARGIFSLQIVVFIR